jgi:glycosyltransferase involved in cell wall biosynthesis
MLKDKTIGVVIPAYNEEKLITKTLASMPDFWMCWLLSTMPA